MRRGVRRDKRKQKEETGEGDYSLRVSREGGKVRREEKYKM